MSARKGSAGRKRLTRKTAAKASKSASKSASGSTSKKKSPKRKASGKKAARKAPKKASKTRVRSAPKRATAGSNGRSNSTQRRVFFFGGGRADGRPFSCVSLALRVPPASGNRTRSARRGPCSGFRGGVHAGRGAHVGGGEHGGGGVLGRGVRARSPGSDRRSGANGRPSIKRAETRRS